MNGTALIVPTAIQEVIDSFDKVGAPLTEHDVYQALHKARSSLQNLTDAETLGAWAEILAFGLDDTLMHASPWGTYFAPLGSRADKDGTITYFPDARGIDARFIVHWSERSRSVAHPVLRARYADLAWDLCSLIANMRRDPENARLAIDAYLASLPQTMRAERHDQFVAALRALDLAIMIRDAERIAHSRASLLQLHREVLSAREPQWWLAFDRLIEERNAGVTDNERQQLVADLEGLLVRHGNTSRPEQFNPHVLEDAAKRLIRYHTRLGRSDDVKRAHEAIARAFEHFASLGDAMLASAVLQTSVNAYRDAGLPDESKRARILMEEKIGQSRAQLNSFTTEIKISRDDMESFLKAIVVEDLAATFIRVAVEFLPSREQLEQAVQKSLETSPLTALMPQKIMADDHIAATIGSVQNDPFGRIIREATMRFGLSAIWLQAALQRVIEVHAPTVEHFVGWGNRLGVFDDVTFLIEGVRSWLDGDLIKAVHVLVPQVEQGLRNIVANLGKPVTKPHATVADVGVAIGMGDILYSRDLTQALGPDLTLYFLALYADPRGMNLRNRVAHGLLKPEAITGDLVRLLVHTCLVFGVWKELSERKR